MRRTLFVLFALVALGHARPAAGQETALERYIALAADSSLAIHQQALRVGQAEQQWSAARRAWFPTVSLEARYSRADGGRSFEIPVGDLMNPVYSTLNDLLENQGSPSPFEPIANQRIDFLRDREQDTRLRVNQVLWNPVVRSSIRSSAAVHAAETAAAEAVANRVARDVRVAYYRYVSAARAVDIYAAALLTVSENERSTEALWQASTVTRDRVHRARAERLEVEQQWEQSRTDLVLAASQLNTLLDRPLGSPIETDPRDLDIEAIETPWIRAPETTVDPPIATLVERALEGRPELAQLAHVVAAAEAGVDVVAGATKPAVALAFDAGIQGPDYGFGSDQRYTMASLVVSWRFTEGGAERARVREARLRRDQLDVQRAELERQIRLEVEAEARTALMAARSLRSSRERVVAAQAAFRLVSRREDEGIATPLEFFDARATLTRAQVGLSIAEADLLIAMSRLEYALGVPLGSPTLSTDTEYDQ